MPYLLKVLEFSFGTFSVYYVICDNAATPFVVRQS